MFQLDCKKTNNLSHIASYDMAVRECSIELLQNLKNSMLDGIIDRKEKIGFYVKSNGFYIKNNTIFQRKTHN